jgi:hypothetical protein
MSAIVGIEDISRARRTNILDGYIRMFLAIYQDKEIGLVLGLLMVRKL